MNLQKKTRYFAIKNDNGNTHGRFAGKTPKQAAYKAFSSIVKNGDCEVNNKFKLCIQEITRGSNRREFFYDAERKKLKKPLQYNIKTNGKTNSTITINYNNKIYKSKD